MNAVIRLGLCVVAVTISGCGVTAIKPYVTPTPNVGDSSGLGLLTVSVVGNDERGVRRVAASLQRTGLFGSVVLDRGDQADLIASVVNSRGGIRCGTFQMLTVFTLGLVPTENAYSATVRIEFSAAKKDQIVAIERDFVAETRHGWWALLLRASKKWKRPDWQGDPAGLSNALKEELLARQSELVRLARRRAA